MSQAPAGRSPDTTNGYFRQSLGYESKALNPHKQKVTVVKVVDRKEDVPAEWAAVVAGSPLTARWPKALCFNREGRMSVWSVWDLYQRKD